MLFGSSTVSQGMSQPAEILTHNLPLRSRLGLVGRVFKEVTVHGGIKSVMNRVITSIALLSSTIPKKHTSHCPWLKLCSDSRWKMNIHNTPKYTRRKRVRGGNRSKGIECCKRGLEFEDFYGKSVCEIGSSNNSLWQKMDRYLSVKHESPCYVKKGTVFAFSNPILLRSVRAGCLMNKTMFKKKLFHCKRGIFTTII